MRGGAKRLGRWSGAGVELMADGAEAAEKPVRPLRPRQCQRYLQETLAGRFQTIVEGFISEAQKGGCAHMKLAVELLEPAQDSGRRKGSAQRLLDELGE